MFMKEHSNIIALIYFQNARGQFRKQARKKCVFGFFPKQRTPTNPQISDCPKNIALRITLSFQFLLKRFFQMILFSHLLLPPRVLFANYRGELTARPRPEAVHDQKSKMDNTQIGRWRDSWFDLGQGGKEAPRLTHTNPVKCSRHDMRQSSFDLT